MVDPSALINCVHARLGLGSSEYSRLVLREVNLQACGHSKLMSEINAHSFQPNHRLNVQTKIFATASTHP